MAKLEVNIYENTGATKDTAPYLGTFVSKGSIDFATLAKQVSKLSGLPPIQAETILRGGIDELTKLERDGAVRINFDGGCIHLVIKGTFDSSDAAFDPEKNSLELVWQLSDDIRNSLANETPKIVTDGTSTKVRLDTVADVETPRPYQLIHGTKPFMCTGINLVTTDAGAEVYLENAIGTKFPCVVDEVVSKQEFTAHVAAAVDPGDYRLVVKSRGGDPEGVLQTTFRKVKYLYIDEALRISSVNSDGMENGHFSRDQPVCIGGKGLADGFEKLVITYTGEEGSPMTMIIKESELAALSDSEIKVGENIWTDTPYPKGAVTFTVHAGGKTASAEATPE